MQKLKKPGLLSRIESTLQPLLLRVSHTLTPLGGLRRVLTTGALIVGCLLILALLLGCHPRIVRPTLPAQADPRPMPQFLGTTFREALIHIPELREWGNACEADKTAIREAFSNE